MKRFATLALAIAAAASAARADVIVLKNGERRSGLVREDPGLKGYIIFTDAGGEVTIARDRILEIREEPEHKGLEAIGNQLFEKKHFKEALEYYRRAAEDDPGNEAYGRLIEAAQGELDRMNNLENQARVAKIAEMFRAARDAMEKGQFDQANRLLTQAETLQPEGGQAEELRQIRVIMLLGWGKERLDKVDRTGATDKFEAVLRREPGNEQANDRLIELWMDNPGKSEQLRAALEAKYEANPKDWATLKMLADIAHRDKQTEKAAQLYQKLYEAPDEWGSKQDKTQVAARLQTLLEAMRNEAAAKPQTLERAIELQKTLMRLFPATDGRLLEVYDYKLRLNRIDPKDEAGLLQLAGWAREKDMRRDAIQLYKKVLGLNPKNNDALRAMEGYAREDLAEGKAMYAKAEYEMARALFEQLIQDFPEAPSACGEAREWSDMALAEMQKQERDRRETAARLVQMADQHLDRAYAFMDQFTQSSLDRPDSRYVVNPRRDAERYFRLAVQTYAQVIQLAPSLPQVLSGEVRRKMAEAQAMLNRLENPIDFGFPPIIR